MQTNLNSIPELNLITNNLSIQNEVSGIFACDLLSHVMGFASEGNILITVLNNINVLGVASLLELSCVIFSYDIAVSDTIINKANELEIPLFRTQLSTAEIIGILSKNGVPY